MFGIGTSLSAEAYGGEKACVDAGGPDLVPTVLRFVYVF